MLLSLRSKVSKLLLAWLLLTVVYIFPEAGLVLFMAIHHWGGGTNGVVEISLWLVRVLCNVCGIVCIQSLWSQWREEKSIFRSLHELSMAHGGLTDGEHDLGLPGHHKLRGSLRLQPALHPRFVTPAIAAAVNNNHHDLKGEVLLSHYGTLQKNQVGQNNLGYNNPAFSSSGLHLNTAASGGGFHMASSKYGGKSLHRSTSSVSRVGSLPSLSMLGHTSYLQQGFSKNEFNPSGLRPGGLSTKNISHSQFDLPSFGLDPDAPVFIQRGHGPGGLPLNVYRGNSRRDKLLGETLEWYRPRSLGSLALTETDHGVGNKAMLSERWTTNRRGEYDTQSLDRRLVRGAGGRPVGDHIGDHLSGHLGDHHGNHLSDHLTKHLGESAGWSGSYTHCGYHSDSAAVQGSRQSLGQMSGLSDCPEKYRDIAL